MPRKLFLIRLGLYGELFKKVVWRVRGDLLLTELICGLCDIPAFTLLASEDLVNYFPRGLKLGINLFNLGQSFDCFSSSW